MYHIRPRRAGRPRLGVIETAMPDPPAAPDRHDAPAGDRQELLYDPDVPSLSHAERARTLAAMVGTGTLCTIAKDPAGYPYGSFVTYGMEASQPVFLVSEMAEHTKNLRANGRCSLLVAEPGDGDPLARGRVTLLGRCAPLAEPGGARDAFLAAHPKAAYYADFKDFAFWRLEVASVRYIGGYGRMSWVSGESWAGAEVDPLAPHAAGIVTHMNEDHAALLALLCRAFSRATDTSSAAMTEVDCYGFEMSAETAAGPRPIRLPFGRRLGTPDEVRQEMIALAKRARASTPAP